MYRRLALTALLAALIPTTIGALPAHSDTRWHWPVTSEHVLRPFDPPQTDYGRGHRGVDLLAAAGTQIVSVAAGTVVHAGPVASVGVVSIDHGALRSTYQPVHATIRVGERVAAGAVIGHLVGAGGHCSSTPCLHLGFRSGDRYVDPLELLGASSRIRLISPEGPPPMPAFAAGAGIPVSGRVTSPFGWRTHPISGGRRFHDGIDFGAPCGTPVRATGSGSVRRAAWAGGYGRRIEIDHGGNRATSYSHLSSFSVAQGRRVTRGQIVGRVGTTGSSTGCHLHYSVHQGGRAVNPR